MRLSAFLQRELVAVSETTYGAGEQPERHALGFFWVLVNLMTTVLFGWAVCMDAFLFLFTFLPARVCLSCTKWVLRPASGIVTPAFRCDVIRIVLILSTVLLLLLLVDLPQMYHWIRMQSMFKLYVIFNIVQIFDRLLCSFGEDALDVIMNNFARPHMVDRWALLLDFALGLAYTFCHSSVLLVHIVTLNVAINSNNTSLLALLVSNNFLELKTSVFKRFSPENLFHITANDIVEWFYLSMFWALILLRNLQFTGWSTDGAVDWAVQGLWAGFWIFGMEFFVDWIKHGFITKFNDIEPEYYTRFKSILCADVVFCRSEHTVFHVMDRSHVISRKVGFVSIPLFCVVVHSILQALKLVHFDLFTSVYTAFLLFLVYLLLFLGKILLSILIVGHATNRIVLRKAATSWDYRSPQASPKASPVQSHLQSPSRSPRRAPEGPPPLMD